ncbi:xyloglucan galactosyltransferase KATAMARI1 homolog [Typha angustifolia]|uniref:xyloglucan galactosyltransferase KATAMARI1 homolog n=1 Tax=Typha angustifolia TaxID=59011 RepID=UPI003C3062E8
MEKCFGKIRTRYPFCSFLPISCVIWFIIFYSQHSELTFPTQSSMLNHPSLNDQCVGRYIYVHDLPHRFNSDMLRDCHILSAWTDMCRFISNAGLGPRLNGADGVFSNTGWYATNQFSLEVIFHNRMKQYECLTTDSSRASAIFVPYYVGLDLARYLWGYNISMRDSTSLDLVRWLKSRPEWAPMGGKDHFLVAGRITWDFRRLTDEETNWGSKFLLLPETKNMTVLVIESSPWHSNDFGIPYPTYFHPSNYYEVVSWQNKMRGMNRPWLFSFAGAPRPNQMASIRGRIIDQCLTSAHCKLLECDFGASKCHSPSSVMNLFQNSVFCLQPQGDSYTRRSIFDAMVAGCVPVFFHPGSAYVQYTWHLPKDYTKYSVFISEDEVREGKVRIEEVLQRYSDEEVRAMREEVISMIPRLIYKDPRYKIESEKDAFDVAVEGVIERVSKVREGVSPAFTEEDSWKYALLGRGGKHEWDDFFSQPR